MKISYIAYPFGINNNFVEDDNFIIPDLLTLSAMKAYAIGRRAKWKDYVDLYFLIDLIGLDKIINKSISIFGDDFSKKMFIRQLSFFDYIDYSEKVEFMDGFKVSDKKIKQTLLNISLNNLKL